MHREPSDRPLRQSTGRRHFPTCCCRFVHGFQFISIYFFQLQPMGHLQGQGLYICGDVVEVSSYRYCSPVCHRFCAPTLLH